MILGFLLTVLYYPGIAGAATTPRWALLAVALPIVLLFSSRGGYFNLSEPCADVSSGRYDPLNWKVKGATSQSDPRAFTLIHLFGVLYLTWSAISLSWTPNRLDGLNEVMKLAVLAQAFVYGSMLVTFTPTLVGMSLGLIASSICLIIEPWYPDLVLHTTTHAGLFINSGSLAEISALVIIGLLHGANWNWRNASLWLAICLLPCVVLPQSRGAWLALIAAFTVWLWSKSKLSALALMALAVISFTYSLHIGFHVSSVTQRLGIYLDALSGLSWLGHGLGSFWTDYAPLSNTLDIFLERPEHIHNDWLEIIFEQGVVGGLIVAMAGISVLSTCRANATRNISYYILAGFAAEALVGFPLHVPCTAFIAALCLGHAARNGADIRGLLPDGRAKLRQYTRWRLTPARRGLAKKRTMVSA